MRMVNIVKHFEVVVLMVFILKKTKFLNDKNPIF